MLLKRRPLTESVKADQKKIAWQRISNITRVYFFRDGAPIPCSAQSENLSCYGPAGLLQLRSLNLFYHHGVLPNNYLT